MRIERLAFLLRLFRSPVDAVAAIVVLSAWSHLTDVAAADRVDRGLIVLYDFEESEGDIVHDRSGTGQPLNLKIHSPGAVEWQDGGLRVRDSVLIASPQPAHRLIEAAGNGQSLTIEAWLTPADRKQSGPARILSVSRNPSERNVTLGQDEDRFDVRLRTTSTSRNGLPSTQTPRRVVGPALTHVVFVRSGSGNTHIYVDGHSVAQGKVSGNLSGWDRQQKLFLANESTGDRPWKGTFHLVAIYDRPLSAEEVRQNFAAGPSARTLSAEERELARQLAARARHFTHHVAPLLAQHCLECHDAAVSKGNLDLSREAAVLRGGESGPALVAGDAQDSLLWQYVESDEMPKGRAPLSLQEKTALKTWIDDGAAWSLPLIDPANYMHEGGRGEVWVQRLTVPEYIATVRAAVGVDISQEARAMLPADLRADGFSNTAYNLGVDLKHVEAYGQLAQAVVEKMDVLKFAGRFSKSRSISTDATMRELVAEMGAWLLRGPLDEFEVNQFSGIATTVASAGGGFEDAVRFIVEAMLQSPRFVYRMERQQGTGAPRRLDDYELAARLSYIIIGGPPDEQLYRAADDGRLTTPEEYQRQIDRLLADPRAMERSLQFIDEWLNLGRLQNLRPDASLFPNWDAALAGDMRQETRAFFREVVWEQERPLSDLLNADVTFATPALAELYGLEVRKEPLSRYDLSAVPERGGLLTQASVLTMGGDQASMVTRGLFVLHDLLRGTVNAPPPCVNTTPPATKSGLTQRGIAQIRIADDNCGVCHTRFEPLAFGLEKFDGIGAYHDEDQHGNQLRDDGEVLFPGQAKPVPYRSSAELMDLLAGSDRVRQSLTWKVAQFCLGRPLTAEDAAVMIDVHQQAQSAGGTWTALINAIVKSDLVRTTGTEP